MSGLFIVFATDNFTGDFEYCKYKWTSQKQRNILDLGILSRTIDSLSLYTSIFAFRFYVKDAKCTLNGSNITIS